MTLLRFAPPIICVVALSGCGNPPPATHPPTLSIHGLGPEAGDQLRQDAIDDFTRRTGAKVDLIPTPGTSSEQLALAMRFLDRHAATPDIYVIDVIWPGTLSDHLLDLTPYLTSDAQGHGPAVIANNTIGSRLIALPFYANTGMLYYRADLLEKYGYAAPPATWRELADIALRIQTGERKQGQKSFWGFVWQGNAYEGLTCNALEWQASFGGGGIVEKDRTVSVNNPQTVRAFENAKSWIGSISPPSVLSYTESDAVNVFRSGNAAFMRHWSSAYRGIADSMEPGAAAVALLPAGPAGRAQSTGGFQLAVSRYSPHPREAAGLVSYLTGQEVQKRRALRRGYVPTYPRLYSDPELARALPQIAVLQGSAPETWVMRPSTSAGKQYAAVSKAYYRAVHSILSGKSGAAAGLAELEAELTRLTAAPRETGGH